jgi:C4-dicarboxylate-specific signal transduction histidine kinase
MIADLCAGVSSTTIRHELRKSSPSARWGGAFDVPFAAGRWFALSAASRRANAIGALGRYLLPFAAVAIACGMTYLLDLAAPESPNLFFFFGAIVITAWYAGAGPGWLAVILSTIAVDYFFIPAVYVLDLNIKDISWLVAFAACSAATNAVGLQRRGMEAMLIRARDELEERIRERTLELQATTEKLTAEAVERARAEAALRGTQNELARVHRIMTVGELTASIAHEVNQPLAAVVANGEAALNWLKRSPPRLLEAKDSIVAVVTAGERAADVISRIRSLMTRGAPAMAKVEVYEFLSSVVALVQAAFAMRDIVLECRLEPGLPCLLGDRIQLQQMVLNLLNNAADAVAEVSEGTRKVVIGAERTAKDHIKISIEDSGNGLVSVDRARLFQPFYSTKQDGMGMGLSICRTIAELHGGTIDFAPRKPRGAIFQVELPAGVAP